MYCISILKSKACSLGVKLARLHTQHITSTDTYTVLRQYEYTYAHMFYCLWKTTFLGDVKSQQRLFYPTTACICHTHCFLSFSFIPPFSHFLLCFIIFLQNSVVCGIYPVSFPLVFLQIGQEKPFQRIFLIMNFIPDYICPLISNMYSISLGCIRDVIFPQNSVPSLPEPVSSHFLFQSVISPFKVQH